MLARLLDPGRYQPHEQLFALHLLLIPHELRRTGRCSCQHFLLHSVLGLDKCREEHWLQLTDF